MELSEYIKYVRFVFPTILIVIHIYHFYSQPFRYCDKEECFTLLPFRCDNIFFLLILILIILEVLYLAYIASLDRIFENLPEEWWYTIPFLGFGIIHLINQNPKRVKEDGSYQIKPDNVMDRDKRISFMSLTLTILIIAILFEIGISLYNRIDKANLKESISTNIFFRDKVDTKNFTFAMVRFIAIPIILFYRYIYDNYGACKYDLPFNWN